MCLCVNVQEWRRHWQLHCCAYKIPWVKLSTLLSMHLYVRYFKLNLPILHGGFTRFPRGLHLCCILFHSRFNYINCLMFSRSVTKHVPLGGCKCSIQISNLHKWIAYLVAIRLSLVLRIFPFECIPYVACVLFFDISVNGKNCCINGHCRK